jgi:hypothetical protein
MATLRIVGVTTGAALAVWVVAHAVLDIDLVVGKGSSAHPVTATSVAVVGVLVSLAAVGLRVLLRRVLLRRAAAGRRTWTVVASVVLVLSLLGPAGAATWPAALALLALHVVVGASLLVGVRRQG